MNLPNSASKSFSLQDVKAGLVVFLIALPLSLGISLASGAPSTAGLISAVMGGLIGAYLGGSYVTINGPAAGLIVVVLTAIQSLAPGDPALGFKRMLACVIVVGMLQIFSGLIKAGRFAALFPLSVVHGMLSAIGLIIIIKQLHVFFGHKAQGSIINSILQIPSSVTNLNPEASLIGLASIILLIAYPFIKLQIAKVIPAPLVVVIVGIGLTHFLPSTDLVKIPTNISAFIITPSFDVIFSRESLLAIFSLFFVASLESILSASAVDKLDPLHRESNFNRELWSKGLVNIACGLMGGLPIIAEIVRSSASISQGAKTPLANFSHSAFILFFLLLFPQVLNMIPLSALAAILILVGYRLAHPKQFVEMKHLGLSSFLAFIATIALTLAEDLLIGIFAGVIVKAVVSYYQGASLSTYLKPTYKVSYDGDKAILEFDGSLLFFSALRQKEILDQLSHYKSVEIDLTRIKFIDATSLAIFSKESHRLEKDGCRVKLNIPDRFKPLYRHVNKS